MSTTGVSNVFRIIAEQLRGHRTLYGHVMSEPADLFRLIDKDGSESLDYNEFKEALRRMDIGLTLRQIREIVAAVDTDANGTIEFGAPQPFASAGRPFSALNRRLRRRRVRGDLGGAVARPSRNCRVSGRPAG